jgi:CRP/FNR family transcriptional regulator
MAPSTKNTHIATHEETATMTIAATALPTATSRVASSAPAGGVPRATLSRLSTVEPTRVAPVSAFSTDTPAPASVAVAPRPGALRAAIDSHAQAAQQIADTLALLADTLRPARRIVHAGEAVHEAGDPFVNLYVVNSGLVKQVTTAPDGRQQISGFRFRGDWLGLEGIEGGVHTCDAIALDTGEVWSFRYEALLAAAVRQPALLLALHRAMSGTIVRERGSLMSVCTLPSDARVADFLHYWAESLARRGLRTDFITLRLTRAEIGNYLGMTLETVSRVLGRLAQAGLISFADPGRRELAIPDVGALADHVQRALAPCASAA